MTQDNATPIANDTPPEREVMCKKCIYWKELPIIDAKIPLEGSCYFHPPVVVASMGHIISAFLTVPADSWCGSFAGDEDDEDEGDEDEDDEPSFEELEEMFLSLLESAGPAFAKLDAIRSVVADLPNRRGMRQMTPKDKERSAAVRTAAMKGDAKAVADAVAELEKD